MTKMTDDELRQAMDVADALNDEGTSTCHHLLAHIAALTAERDEAREALRSMTTERDTGATHLKMAFHQIAEVAGLLEPDVTPDGWGLHAAALKVLAERDALRERVTALEAEVNEQRARKRQFMKACDTYESRLSAIRQRAGECIASGNKSDARAARYILGDDATTPSEMDGLRGKMAEPQRCVGCRAAGVDLCAKCEAEAKASQDAMAAAEEMATPDPHDCDPRTFGDVEPPPEPTTAEAFATVRAGRQWWADSAADAPVGVEAWRDLALLSLLERRMGAMRRAAELAPHGAHCAFLVSAPAPWNCDCWKADALTDAPEVYTREEVESACVAVAREDNIGNEAGGSAMAEAHSNGWTAGALAVSERLTTLRK